MKIYLIKKTGRLYPESDDAEVVIAAFLNENKAMDYARNRDIENPNYEHTVSAMGILGEAEIAEKVVKIYVCGVDWQHELGETTVNTYPSEKSAKKNMSCHEECGLVELDVKLSKWIVKQDLFRKLNAKDDKPNE